MDTLAVFMMVKNLRLIARLLTAHGKAKDSPALVVLQAHGPLEPILFSTPERVANEAEAAGIEPTAVLLVWAVRGAKTRQGDRDV